MSGCCRRNAPRGQVGGLGGGRAGRGVPGRPGLKSRRSCTEPSPHPPPPGGQSLCRSRLACEKGVCVERVCEEGVRGSGWAPPRPACAPPERVRPHLLVLLHGGGERQPVRHTGDHGEQHHLRAPLRPVSRLPRQPPAPATELAGSCRRNIRPNSLQQCGRFRPRSNKPPGRQHDPSLRGRSGGEGAAETGAAASPSWPRPLDMTTPPRHDHTPSTCPHPLDMTTPPAL